MNKIFCQSLFVLRPDGFILQEPIISEIQKNFNLIYQRTFTFDDNLARKFYHNDILKPHFEALLEYLQEGTSLVGIVSAKNAVEKLFELAGKETIPSKCSIDSLRYRYSEGDTYTKSGKQVIKNLIHRSKTHEQYLNEKVIFENFFKNKQ